MIGKFSLRNVDGFNRTGGRLLELNMQCHETRSTAMTSTHLLEDPDKLIDDVPAATANFFTTSCIMPK